MIPSKYRVLWEYRVRIYCKYLVNVIFVRVVFYCEYVQLLLAINISAYDGYKKYLPLFSKIWFFIKL